MIIRKVILINFLKVFFVLFLLMDFPSFVEEFNEAKEKKLFVVFFCNCEINYSGRAEAYLPAGDRLIMLKQDSSLLIHQPENGSPINYLKAPVVSSIINHESFLELKANNGNDYLDIKIFRVYDFVSRKLEDGQKQVLVGNEKDMSDMIKDNPEIIGPDFKPLSREEHTKFGFIDVFGHDGQGNLVVVECKRYPASLSCVTQLRRYVEKMKELKGTDKVKGVMASPSITPNAEALLKKLGFRHVRVVPPKKLEVAKDQKKLFDF